jgi:hypothetical protein
VAWKTTTAALAPTNSIVRMNPIGGIEFSIDSSGRLGGCRDDDPHALESAHIGPDADASSITTSGRPSSRPSIELVSDGVA